MVMNLLTRLRMLRRNDSGQDLLEYALLVALIALVAIGAITTTGQGVSTVFQDISDQLGTPESVGTREGGRAIARPSSVCVRLGVHSGHGSHTA